MTLITGFFCGFLLPYFFYGVADLGRRLIWGIVFAFVVGVADLYFVLKFFLEAEGVINRPKKAKAE